MSSTSEARPAGPEDGRPAVAVVGIGGAVDLLELVEAARDTCDLVLVNVDATAWTQPDRAALDTLVRTVDGAGRSVDELCRLLGPCDVGGVVTFRDELVPTVAAIAERLGLAYHSEATARAVTHKDVQRRLLAGAGLAQPRLATFTDEAGVAAAAREVGFPAVLKPVCGNGSTDVVPVEDLDELREALSRVDDGAPVGATSYRDRPGFDARTPWLLEQRMVGSGHPGAPWLADYVSVETLSLGTGDHWHFWVTDRLPMTPPLREGGAGGPSLLPGALRDEVCHLVARGLDALGVRSGISHTEVKLTDDGPRIIEVNGRLGGMIATLVGRAAGVDVVRLALLSALGTAGRVPLPHDRYSFVVFGQLPARATGVRSMLPVAQLRELPGVWRVDVHAGAGSRVDDRVGILGRLRTIWLTGGTPEEIRGTCAEAARLAENGDRYTTDETSVVR